MTVLLTMGRKGRIVSLFGIVVLKWRLLFNFRRHLYDLQLMAATTMRTDFVGNLSASAPASRRIVSASDKDHESDSKQGTSAGGGTPTAAAAAAALRSPPPLLPLPLQIVERYKKWHSVEALRRDPDVESRNFVLGFYSCPYSAGNGELCVLQ